jgi:hypothetical protein
MPVSAWFLDKLNVNTTAWARADVVNAGLPPAIVQTTIPNATLDVPYLVQLTTNKGSNVTWSSVGLAPGVTLNPLTGFIGGAPTSPGAFSPVVTATIDGTPVQQQYSMTVAVPSNTASLIANPPSVVMTLSGGPVSITLTDGLGNPLSGLRSANASAEVTKPGYVQPSKYFVSGQLTLTPVAVGSSVVTVVYGDQTDQEVSVQIPVAVVP